MTRIPLAATLLLGLAAAPALAQTAPTPDDAAARTMQQNQRAYIPQPPRPQVAQDAILQDRPVAALPSVAGRRVVLADRTAR